MMKLGLSQPTFNIEGRLGPGRDFFSHSFSRLVVPIKTISTSGSFTAIAISFFAGQPDKNDHNTYSSIYFLLEDVSRGIEGKIS